MTSYRQSENDKLLDLDLYIHVTTPKAVLVSDDGNKLKAEWLPLSQCEITPKHGAHHQPNTAIITLPTWLAREKGFI